VCSGAVELPSELLLLSLQVKDNLIFCEVSSWIMAEGKAFAFFVNFSLLESFLFVEKLLLAKFCFKVQHLGLMVPISGGLVRQ